MPNIHFESVVIPCEKGTNLRKALLKAGLSPHNGQAKWLNCKGLGSCGTCAVSISGAVSPLTAMERWRLNFPPHTKASGLRLACQCSVQQDIWITKHQGFWGEQLKKNV